jgi:hypothetical protein
MSNATKKKKEVIVASDAWLQHRDDKRYAELST